MSQVPATQADEMYTSSGLDDFGMTDAVLPRISIGHATGVWKDNLTNSERPELRFIPLGLVKQRVLFHTNVEDGDVPMCKSSDFNLGFPNIDAPRQKSFPWDKSGFDPNDFPPIDDVGNRALPCNGCQLKEWNSHPNGTTPYCSEQWTLPIYYDASDDESGEWTPAILTLQKSQLKPIRQYLTSFKSANRAPFLSVARAKLKVITRGQVTYSVPSFIKEEESPRDRWAEFAGQFEDMKKYLTRPPVREDEGEGVPETNNVNTAPSQAAPAPAADPQQAAPSQGQPVAQQQDPWASTPPQQEQAVPTQPAPTQAPPPQQPAAQPAPEQVAPQQPVAPAQTATPAPQPQQGQPSSGQKLPF